MPAPGAIDEQVAQRLWEASERLAGVHFRWDKLGKGPVRLSPPHMTTAGIRGSSGAKTLDAGSREVQKAVEWPGLG